MEHHQRELTALQTVHAEKLHTLSQRHQNEVDQLQFQIEQLHKTATYESKQTHSATSGRSEGEVEALRQRIADMEKTQVEYSQMKAKLEQLTVENSRLTDTNTHLTSQLERENVSLCCLAVV